MDPKYRPTFEDLVVQLEQIIHSRNPPDTPIEVVTGDESSLSSSPEIGRQSADKIVQQAPMISATKFDHDVYLVPGSSPSEKARCHYLQGRSNNKEKPLEYEYLLDV